MATAKLRNDVIFFVSVMFMMDQVKSWNLCSKDALLCTSRTIRKACHCDHICGLMGDCCRDYDRPKWSADNIKMPELAADENNTTQYDNTSADVLMYRGHLECHSTLPGSHRYKISTYLPQGNFIYVKTCPETFLNEDVITLCENDNTTDTFLNWFVTSRATKVTYRNIFCSKCWNDTNIFQWKVEYYCDNASDPVNPNFPTGSPFSGGISKGFTCLGPLVPTEGRPGVHNPVIAPPGFNSAQPPGISDPTMPGSKTNNPPSGMPRPPGTHGRQPGVVRRSVEDADTRYGSSWRRQLPVPQYQPVASPLIKKSDHGLVPLPPPKQKYERSSRDLRYFDARERLKRWSYKPSNQCKPTFVYPFCDNLRACVDLKMVSTCQDRWKGTAVETSCVEGDFGRMTLDETTFRNTQCVVCNGINPELPNCSQNVWLVSQPGYSSELSPPPLSMIFDPEAGKLVKEIGPIREGIPLPKCSATQILDVFAYKCRDVYCSDDYELISGECTRIKNTKVFSREETPCIRWVKFREGGFEIQNSSILLILTGHIIPLEETTIRNLTNSSVLICDELLPYGWNVTKITFNNSEGVVVISILFQTISLICLVVQFVVYILLPELRNTPGLTIMSLVVALFNAQFLLLISGTAAGNRGGCVFIACSVHYFFLASFCWMCSLALDLALTFSSNVFHRGDDQSKIRRFIKFSLFGWLIPLVVVLLALLTDAGQGNTYPYNPGYGQGFCWITNKEGLILWFLTPVALLLGASFALYILTVYKIVQASKATRMVRKEDKLHVFLYVKLSLIMGLTWVFAFIWIGTKDIVTEYLFIIFNSLQGAFIFLAFVCRRNVYRLLKRKVKGKKSVSSRPTLTSRLRSTSSGRKSML